MPHIESAAAPPGQTGLAIRVRSAKDGPVLAVEPVLGADLRESSAELWWLTHARRGRIDLREEDMPVRIDPIPADPDTKSSESRAPDTPDPNEADSRCHGFVLSSLPSTARVDVTCSIKTLDPVARRVANRLVAEGVLAPTDTFYYDLVATAETTAPAVGESAVAIGTGQVITRSRDLRLERLPLEALIRESSSFGIPDEGEHPLFFTDRAWSQAETIARRGEGLDPRLETGGVLLGHVAYCDAARDAFVVVTDALEAKDADNREFSLTFHSQTWQRLQSILRVRRAQPGEETVRLLGQAHGHPFDAGTPCAECPQTKDCPNHTAYLSEDDRHWCRAVFCAEPWQVGVLFGINARGEPTSNVYGQRGGRLEPRGYRVLPETALDAIRLATHSRPDPTQPDPLPRPDSPSTT